MTFRRTHRPPEDILDDWGQLRVPVVFPPKRDADDSRPRSSADTEAVPEIGRSRKLRMSKARSVWKEELWLCRPRPVSRSLVLLTEVDFEISGSVNRGRFRDPWLYRPRPISRSLVLYTEPIVETWLVYPSATS